MCITYSNKHHSWLVKVLLGTPPPCCTSVGQPPFLRFKRIFCSLQNDVQQPELLHVFYLLFWNQFPLHHLSCEDAKLQNLFVLHMDLLKPDSECDFCFLFYKTLLGHFVNISVYTVYCTISFPSYHQNLPTIPPYLQCFFIDWLNDLKQWYPLLDFPQNIASLFSYLWGNI